MVRFFHIWACPFAKIKKYLQGFAKGRAATGFACAAAILFASLKGSASPSHPSRLPLRLADSSLKDTTQQLKPPKAALYSTLLPGLGQAYNKKYWKIPIVYLTLGTLGSLAYNNHKQYLIFRNALRARYDNDPTTTDNFPNINDQVLLAQREFYRRNRDLSIIIGVIAYGLNILDAYVDAHLKDFSVSDKLSIKPMPSFHGFLIQFAWKIH